MNFRVELWYNESTGRRNFRQEIVGRDHINYYCLRMLDAIMRDGCEVTGFSIHRSSTREEEMATLITRGIVGEEE